MITLKMPVTALFLTIFLAIKSEYTNAIAEPITVPKIAILIVSIKSGTAVAAYPQSG